MGNRAKFDIIQLEFPDLRADVEDWLWLDRKIPTNQTRLVEAEQIIDSLLDQFGCDSKLISEAQKAKYLFQKIGEPGGFDIWNES